MIFRVFNDFPAFFFMHIDRILIGIMRFLSGRGLNRSAMPHLGLEGGEQKGELAIQGLLGKGRVIVG